MKLSDLDYNYPPELVAQNPLQDRSRSRMLVLHKASGKMEHATFHQIVNYLPPQSLIVMNNSKVFPCRLFAQKETGGKVEVLLLKETNTNIWECLLQASKKIKEGTELFFHDKLRGTVLNAEGFVRSIQLHAEGPLFDILNDIGHIPLPPYIQRQDQKEDLNRYQTVYASQVGSAAAPTAGLHFTDQILSQLQENHMELASITLHVGLGTFAPIRHENIQEHAMHGEHYEISPDTASKIRNAIKQKRPIVAIGTTTVRTLESAFHETNVVQEGLGYTKKFIYPPYNFKIVSHLLTNFHQPKTSLLALISALAGLKNIQNAYQEAIQEKYRLFSYGDCMLIL